MIILNMEDFLLITVNQIGQRKKFIVVISNGCILVMRIILGLRCLGMFISNHITDKIKKIYGKQLNPIKLYSRRANCWMVTSWLYNNLWMSIFLYQELELHLIAATMSLRKKTVQLLLIGSCWNIKEMLGWQSSRWNHQCLVASY